MTKVKRICSFPVHKKAIKKVDTQQPVSGLEHRTVKNFDDLLPQANSFDVISFDLFDTVVYRDCALSTIFHRTAEQGARIIPSQSSQGLYSALLAARGDFSEQIKEKGFRKDGTNEIKLDVLFEHALRPFVSSKSDRQAYAQQLVDFEIELEMQALQVMPGFISFAQKMLLQNKDIILISDQYLPRTGILAILRRLNILDYFKHIYVSSDVGLTKHSGQLFDFVAEELSLEKERCLHLGDNHNNDYTQAIKHGWHARHFISIAGEEYRAALSIQYALFHKHHHLSAELTHEILDGTNAYDGELERIIAQIIAPALTYFTLESIVFANKNGAKNIFGMTRDGTLFGEIAKDVFKQMPSLRGKDKNISVKSIALSRKLSSLAFYPGRSDTGWLIFMTSWMAQKQATIPILMSTYGITEEELQSCVPALAECLKDKDEENQQNQTLEKILNEQSVTTQKQLETLLFQKRNIMLAYLEQQGVLGTDACILLDIGYSGTALKFLSKYAFRKQNLLKYSKLQIHQLMFATNRFLSGNYRELHPGICLHEGLMLNHSCVEDRPLVLNFGWLEPFTRDPDLGRHMGYRHVEDKIQPIFETVNKDPVAEKVRALILQQTHNCLRGFMLNPSRLEQQKDVILNRLRRLITRPTRKEALAISTLSHDYGMVGDNKVNAAVRKIGLNEWPRLKELANEDVWLQGSAALSHARFAQPLINSWLRKNS